MSPSLRARTATLAGSVLLGACGGGNAASQLARAPDYQPKDQTRCSVTKSQAHPLVVEWPSSDRLELETKIRQSIVAVRYVGCEMTVLARCSVPAGYRYVGATRKRDEQDITDEDELYANLPIGAAALEGKLRRSGKLTVKMDLVGRYEATRTTVRDDELQGECAGATHFIYGVTVGAFDFYAAGKADVGGSVRAGHVGAGGESEAERDVITKDGDPTACEAARPDDAAPPPQCGALLRVEVVPLGAPAPPTCPDGASWNGASCVGAAPRSTPPPTLAPPAVEDPRVNAANGFRDLRFTVAAGLGTYSAGNASGAVKASGALRIEHVWSSGLPGLIGSIGLDLDLNDSGLVTGSSTLYVNALSLGLGYGLPLGEAAQLELLPYAELLGAAIDHPYSGATAWGAGGGVGGRITVVYTFGSLVQLALGAGLSFRWLHLAGDYSPPPGGPSLPTDVTMLVPNVGASIGKRF